MRRHYPVVIVGAGPTGLTLANLLGRYGIECALVERNAATVQEPRAVSIDDESLRTMQAAGIAAEVLAETVAGYGSHYHSASGDCFARVQPTEQPFGYPRRSAFRQPVLERQLREALGRFSHVTTAFRHELVAFEQDQDRVRLRLRQPDGAEAALSCDYLVGCDGASSLVRRTLGIEMQGSSFNERWLILDLEDSPAASPHTKVFCDPKRACIALPGPRRTRRYEFRLHAHERDEDLLKDDTVQHLLATHEADPGSRIVRKVVYTFHARLAERWSKRRVLLAGDAAHLMPPFAGQGMNSGLRDANNLAWKLAAIVRGELGPGLLASYELERRGHAAAMIDLALRMGRIMAPRSAAEAWLVQTGFRLLGIYPPARDYIAQMRFKPPPRFAAGFLLADRKSTRKTLVGRLFPQPLVGTADGRSVLLDDALGSGFAILIRSTDPQSAVGVLGALDDRIWTRLGARAVLMIPAQAAAPSTDGVVTVREQSTDRRLADYDNHVFLLRPDRYVMAAIPAGEIRQQMPAVASLLAGTFGRANA